MLRYRTQALLLRSVDYGESDRIVHLLTPDRGRVTAIAKGARRSVKRFSGTLDLFNHLVIRVVQNRRMSMARLEGAALQSAFLGLRTSPPRFALAAYLMELLDRMAPEGGAVSDARRLFGFAHGALRVLETSVATHRLRVLLELRALAALGLQPELRRCVACGREPDETQVGFQVAEGGVVCGACSLQREGTAQLHLGTVRALERSLHLRLDQLGRLGLSGEALTEARQLMDRFKGFHVGVELRSEAVLNVLLAHPHGGMVAQAVWSDRHSRAPLG